jgi:predicted alpha-1,6-mannanase (GH76 family)
MTKEELESMFNGIVEHYNHACEKHPFFADGMCLIGKDWEKEAKNIKDFIAQRANIKETVTASMVLHAEIFEIFAAFCSENYAQARYEVLDAIAVLLRMDDMIRSFQTTR